MSKLTIVPTPIGNLEDMTLRAIRILKESDIILCEDTRVTRKLLNHYDISVKTISYHTHSTLFKTDKIKDLLEEGNDLALVSDAGTPTISDPGSRLVSLIQEEMPEVEISALPGACAVTTALSMSGFPSSEFLFLGFLPHKKGRKTLFDKIANTEMTTVFYESPHRILKALNSLSGVLNEKRRIAVCKELTKIHEEVVKGTVFEVIEYFNNNPDRVRGEFVVIVESN